MFYSVLCQWSKSRLRQVYWCCGNWFTPYFEPLMYHKQRQYYNFIIKSLWFYANRWNAIHNDNIMDLQFFSHSLFYESNEILIISFWCSLPDFAAPYKTDNGPVYLYVRFRKMNFCNDLVFRRHTSESINFEFLDSSSSSISSTFLHNWSISPFSWVI